MFKDIDGSSQNIGYQHNVGLFREIFTTTWLGADNRLMPNDGWCTVHFNPTTNITSFKNYSFGTTTPVYFQYQRDYEFPKFVYGYYKEPCTTGNKSTIPNDPPTPIYTEIIREIPKFYLNGDFNGDGLSDVIIVEKPFTYAYTNGCITTNETYTGGRSYFLNLDRRINSNYINYALGMAVTLNSNLLVDDVNGDGKSDILVFDTGMVRVYTLNDTKQLILLWQTTDSSINLNFPILLGDYNGDGKTDFIIPKGYNKYAKYISSGKSFYPSSVVYDIPFNPNSGDDCPVTSYIIPTDFDQDGKTDLILAKNVACPSTSNQGFISIRNYSNTGTGFVSTMYKTTELITGIGAFALPIFLNKNKQKLSKEISFMTNNKIFHFTSNKNLKEDCLLRSITLGNGVKDLISYATLDYDTSLSDNSVYTPLDILI